MPRFDDRFARQNRFGPPSGFPLTSSYPGIVHHLSGPNIYALTQTFHQRIMVGRSCHLAVSDLLPSLRMWVCHPNTRTYVRLLGPCFKTGQLRPFCQLPVISSPTTRKWSSHHRHNMLSQRRTTTRSGVGSTKRDKYPQQPTRRSQEDPRKASSKASDA